MGNTAEIGAATQHRNTDENPKAAHRTIAERGTAWAPGVVAVRAAVALVGRQVVLVNADRLQEDATHGIQLPDVSPTAKESTP
jgi:hypothetical protein